MFTGVVYISRYIYIGYLSLSLTRSVRAKHFLIHEDGVVKLSGLRSVAPMIEEGSRLKVSGTRRTKLWVGG